MKYDIDERIEVDGKMSYGAKFYIFIDSPIWAGCACGERMNILQRSHTKKDRKSGGPLFEKFLYFTSLIKSKYLEYLDKKLKV